MPFRRAPNCATGPWWWDAEHNILACGPSSSTVPLGSHEEVAGFRDEWQAARETAGGGRFAAFPTEWDRTLPAPALRQVGVGGAHHPAKSL